jgi:hypothetical protein
MNQQAPKLVLSLETLMRLQPPAEAKDPGRPPHTHPTTTATTIQTGCC